MTSLNKINIGRFVRYLLRLPLLALHVFVVLPFLLIILISPLARHSRTNVGFADWAVRKWSAGLMRIFGFKMRRFGTPLSGPALFVANHISWIDIVALHSQRWMGFVAKAEIERWPIVGWCASRGGTIYHHRGNNDSLSDVMNVMLERLNYGRAIGVFPEGRTSRGDKLGVFHARIFQPAVIAQVPAQPVALKFGTGGNAQTIIAFAENENFMQNFIRLLGEPSRICEVHFLEPITASEDGRRKMADYCHRKIAHVLSANGNNASDQR